MNEWIKNNKRTINFIGVILVYILLLMPYIFSILHALPTSDDFCMTLNGENHLWGSLSYTGTKYMNWSGEFLYFFLQYFINPLAFAGLDSYLYGITLCVFFLFFVFSFRFFIKSWIEGLFDIADTTFIEWITVLLISILLFSNNYHEVFYWYVGAFYEVEYALAFLAIGYMIRYYKTLNGELRYYIGLIITGLFSCNAVNMCVIIGISYIYIVTWNLVRENKKIEKRMVIPFVLYVLMGIVTVFAPGNFARKSPDGGGTIVKAAVRALTCGVRRIFYLSENNIVFYLFVVVFFIGLIVNCKYGKKIGKISVLIPLLAICLYGTMLPVAIGYGDAKILNNRVCFLIDAITVPIMEIYILGLGMKLSEKLKLQLADKDKMFITVALICLFYAIVIKDNGYGACEYINQVSNIQKVKQERNLWIGIYNDIYESTDENVEITVPDDMVVESGVLENPTLDEDPNFWINSEICRYFKKQSISVILNEID